MKITALFVALMVLITACGSKKKKRDEADKNFPVLPYLLSQVKDVDTSLYSIIKVVTVDSVADTTFVPREDFRKEASDFLDIPDISSEKYEDDYTESKFFDETLNRVVMTYTKKPDAKHAVLKQEITISPNQYTGDKIVSVYVDYATSSKDSAVQKRMLWMVDKNFQVTRMVQKPGGIETTTTTTVKWND
ncbi:hypothetical protein ACFS6H_01325 [Terrimonas rubra]|uniref:Lipoprotein n=1 Tax=Terrimonas rubra TaxID=1035890 RepID=A0ABW5ZZ75_9BACT